MGEKSGETKKETDWLGREKEVHYDSSGHNVGETRFTTDWKGSAKQEHYDPRGDKVGETRRGSDWLGKERAEHFDSRGERVGYSRNDSDILGRSIQRHYDTLGDQVGTTRRETDIWGTLRREHSGRYFKGQQGEHGLNGGTSAPGSSGASFGGSASGGRADWGSVTSSHYRSAGTARESTKSSTALGGALATGTVLAAGMTGARAGIIIAERAYAANGGSDLGSGMPGYALACLSLAGALVAVDPRSRWGRGLLIGFVKIAAGALALGWLVFLLAIAWVPDPIRQQAPLVAWAWTLPWGIAGAVLHVGYARSGPSGALVRLVWIFMLVWFFVGLRNSLGASLPSSSTAITPPPAVAQTASPGTLATT